MARVEMECQSPESLKVKMSIELTLGEWREVESTLRSTVRYQPLTDMMIAIKTCLDTFDNKYNARVEKGHFT